MKLNTARLRILIGIRSMALPWIVALVGFPWTAYGVSQAMYYRKSMKENTAGGIKYDQIMEEARKISAQYENAAGFDFSNYENNTGTYAEEYTYEATDNVDDYQI